MIGEIQNQDIIPSGDLTKDLDSLTSISKILNSISNYPNSLRRNFRGEGMWLDENDDVHWVQNVKPVFVEMKDGKPLMEKTKMPWKLESGQYEYKEIYVPNNEAIEELISILQFMGVNLISPVGFNTEDNFLDDLKEFECKLAGLLCLKQPKWGLDKELLPMIQLKIKTIVQDVRCVSVKGNFIKATLTTVQRVEQTIERIGETKKMGMSSSPYH